MTVRIHRSDEAGWTRLANVVLRDPSLTLRAKGLLVQLLSHEDGWQQSLAYAERQCADGRQGVASAFNELMRGGYATRSRAKDASGRFRGWNYDIYETRITGEVSGLSVIGDTVIGDTVDGEAHTLEEPLEEEPQVQKNPGEALAPAARPRDEVWDALVAIYGQPTASGKGAMNAAGKVLRDFGADPAEIIWMANVLRRTDLSWAVTTPTALAKHFGERHALVAELDKKPFDRAAAIANGDLGG